MAEKIDMAGGGMLEREIESAARVAAQAAAEAGREIERIRRSGDLAVRYKAESNLVTAADTAAERIIIDRIRTVFPADSILSEEFNPDYTKADFSHGRLWIIDPVDGTTNYARGHNHVGISIAFAIDGAVQSAIVHAPFQGETFTAVRGLGAFMNGMPIHVSEVSRLKSALVATGFPYVRDELTQISSRVADVLSACQDIRRLGAASLDLSWVACGRLEAYYEDVQPWDMAAGGLIAREAGAAVLHLGSGGALPDEINGQGLLVCVPALAGQFIELLSDRMSSKTIRSQER